MPFDRTRSRARRESRARSLLLAASSVAGSRARAGSRGKRSSIAVLLLAALTIAALTIAALTIAAPALGSGDPGTVDPGSGDPGTVDPGYLLVKDLLSEGRKTRRAAVDGLLERNDPSLAFGIVDALFYIPRLYRDDAVEALRGLTGEEHGARYWQWVEVMGSLGEEIRPAAGYADWKRVLLSKIDEGYREILYPGAPTTLRLEEVVSGGVPIEGIPSLDDPTMAPASEVGYLDDDESVFGVVVNGEARAYPLRLLDWHEMLNDTVGGEPVTLSYCTLCGSGVLFHTRKDDGTAWRFGTSGLLYRSNKLMFDRETRTLWSNLLGVPVLGKLVGRDLALPLLPHTRTTWGEWRERHPETLAVVIDKKLKKVARQHGFDYQPGAADRARRGVRFPVWKKSPALDRDAEIYALRRGTAVKAYPLELLLERRLVNDTVGGDPVVLVADPESGAVRAYLRSAEGGEEGLGDGGELRQDPADRNRLLDAAGREYRVEETHLAGPDGLELERLPGHFAFWFGWYAFHPRTEVFAGSNADDS